MLASLYRPCSPFLVCAGIHKPPNAPTGGFVCSKLLEQKSYEPEFDRGILTQTATYGIPKRAGRAIALLPRIKGDTEVSVPLSRLVLIGVCVFTLEESGDLFVLLGLSVLPDRPQITF